MTLPQETISQIEKDAEHYANLQWTEKAKYIWHLQSDKWDSSKEDYNAGATKWAGKAHDLANAIEIISKAHPSVSGAYAMKEIALNALAKYKEVSNG